MLKNSYLNEEWMLVHRAASFKQRTTLFKKQKKKSTADKIMSYTNTMVWLGSTIFYKYICKTLTLVVVSATPASYKHLLNLLVTATIKKVKHIYSQLAFQTRHNIKTNSFSNYSYKIHPVTQYFLFSSFCCSIFSWYLCSFLFASYVFYNNPSCLVHRKNACIL